MNVSGTTVEPSGIPPGLPAELAAAVLWFVGQIVKLLGWRLAGHRHEGVSIPLRRYLNGCARRFARVMARLESGAGFRGRASRAGEVRAERAAPRVRLPMTYGWVSGVSADMGMTAAIIGFHLNRAEVAPMIAACPQAQRVLRPMCWMLAIDAPCVWPEGVRRRRARARGIPVVAPPSPRPSPTNVGEGEVGRGGEARRLTRKEREAVLWYPNLEGKPMKLLPKKLPDD